MPPQSVRPTQVRVDLDVRVLALANLANKLHSCEKIAMKVNFLEAKNQLSRLVKLADSVDAAFTPELEADMARSIQGR
ncbi:MAG: hypothetical protein ABIT71_25325 [Vicinamibacteraceae bacterium]